jgi:hypothetical protein
VLGYAFFALGGSCMALSLWHIVSTRSTIEQDVRSGSWTELTHGGLTKQHSGPLLTFWASGRIRAGEARTTVTDILVAVDEGALVVVQGQPWPRRRHVAWLERTEAGPPLRVRPGHWGTVISEEGSGILLRRPDRTPEQVTLDLRRRGWIVDGVPLLDDLPPAPGGDPPRLGTPSL